MLKVPEVSIPDNGLGLKLQDKRPLNGPYLRSTGFNIPVMSTNTNPVQRSQSQQKDSLHSRNSKVASMSKGKAPERAQTGSSVAIEDLVHQLVLQKDEAKESYRLLNTALDKLEVMQKRTVVAEERHNGEAVRGARITQSILEVQEQVTKARQDAEVYRLELEKKQQEIRRQQDLMRTIEAERDLAEKEAAKARDLARQLNDERLIALARQEGRKKGFIEGMTQGRKIVAAGRNRAPSSALIKEFDERVHARRNLRARPSTPPAEVARRNQEAADAARKEQEAIEAARKAQEAAEVARREQEAIEAARRAQEAAEVARREQEAAEAARKQLEAVEAARKQFEAIESARRELEAAKRAAEERVWRDAEEKERRRQKEALEAERQREVVRAAEREHEQRRINEREAELEREKEALRQREAAHALELEAIMKRQEEKEKELAAERARERQLEAERDNERRQREEREAELERERARIRELEVERDASSTSSMSRRSQAKRLEYLPMPEPPPFQNPRPGTNSSKPSTPAGTQSPLPPHILPPNFRPPQQFQPLPNGANPRARSHNRRASQSSQETSGSGSGSTSLNNLDIVTFPNAELPRRLGSHLSDIPEVASDIARSPVQSVGPGQGNEKSPVDARMRPVQTRMESVEEWVQSTAASELNTPTEPDTAPMPGPSTWPNPSPHGSNGPPGSTSSGTIHIEVQPPSRPISITSSSSPQQEDAMFLSPNSRPLQLGSNGEAQAQAQRPQQLSPLSPYQNQRHLESEQPGFVPVIPDLNGDDGIRHLMNFGTPGFIPISIMRTNTSEGSSRSTAESERREQEKRAMGGIGSRIYGPSASSSSTTAGARSLYAQSQTQTPRMQIYAVPVQSSSTSASQRQSQTPRQTPRQIYSSISASGSVGSQSNIYGPPQSSRISNIYAPPASTTPQRTPNAIPSAGPTPSTSGIPAVIPSSPRQPASIYGPPTSPRTMPINPPASQSSSLQIPASGSDPSIPVIPPSPQRQIYSPNTNGLAIPSSSANGYPYPVSPGSRSGVIPGIGGATPRIHNASLPGLGVNTRTPGGSLAPLPTVAGRGSAMATPRSNTSALPRGSATPRAPSMTLEEEEEDEEEDEQDDHDLETRMNTEANRSGRGGVTLQIPPMRH